MDSRFGSLPGVVRTTTGYTGGTTPDPDYRHIGDHSEAVRVDFDPREVSYRQLLDVFWRSHEPGLETWSRQYRNAIFTLNAGQRKTAEQTRADFLSPSQRPIYTTIEQAGTFFPAESRHQKYLLRQAQLLLDDLRTRYGGEPELLMSTPATRINGYLGCNGTLPDLQGEIDSFGLSSSARRRLLEYVMTFCKEPAGPTCPAPR